MRRCLLRLRLTPAETGTETFLTPRAKKPFRLSPATDSPEWLPDHPPEVRGSYGLITACGVRFSDAAYESARVNMNRMVPRDCQLKQYFFYRYGVVRKPQGVKMGKGKALIDYYEYRIPPLTVLFEIYGPIHPKDAYFILGRGSESLPGKYHVAKKGLQFADFRHLDDQRIREFEDLQMAQELAQLKKEIAEGRLLPNQPVGRIQFPPSPFFPARRPQPSLKSLEAL
eukprot:RCo024090